MSKKNPQTTTNAGQTTKKQPYEVITAGDYRLIINNCRIVALYLQHVVCETKGTYLDPTSNSFPMKCKCDKEYPQALRMMALLKLSNL